jgi:hypothetical protein
LHIRLCTFLFGLVLLTGGCATPETWERVSPDPEGYRDYVQSVTAAYRQADGNVVICVTGQKAAVPPLVFGRLRVEPFSLILPADAGSRVEPGEHAALPRYVPAPSEIGGPCPENSAAGIPLPVRVIESRDAGHPDFDWIQDEALAEAIASQKEVPAVLVFMSEGWWRPGKRPDTETEGWWREAHAPSIVFIAARPRFDGARAVLVDPGLRPVDGNPAYVAALPAAAVLDILAFPIFVVAVVTGAYKG